MRSKRDTVNELSEIDKELDNGLISETNILRRLELKSKLLNINDMESKDYIQKAKVTWAIEGNENSKFFHGIINKKRSQLAIRCIFVDGTWCTEPGCVYKVITKVLANRLREVISDLVSNTQSAFISRRQILAGPFILDELIQRCKRRKQQSMFFKVDFAKAYDSIRWDYLLDVLESFGFGQGDPLAPYLFILVMESLHLSIRRLVDSGLYNGILLPGSETISHLFYADDVMFIGVTVGGRMTRLKAWDNVIAKLRTLPSGVLKTMEAIRSRFFNGMGQEDFKITWIAWNKVLASKKRGGLGFSSFFALNRAILLKWVWRFISQDGSLWNRVIRALYGPNLDSHTTQFSSNWCAIVKELHLLKDKEVDFRSHCKKRVGNGTDTSFCFNDPWFCDLSGDDEFRVKELRYFIDDKYLPSHIEPTRWVKLVSIKANIFVWRARRDCLPTRTNLGYRGVDLASLKCPICLDFDEDINHILFRCDVAQNVLRRVCCWWNLVPQGWTSFLEWQSWFLSLRSTSRNKDLLEGMFYVAWWFIWRFRNLCVFEDRPPRRSTLFDDIVSYSFN
uniref:RNA-directed DNA polymerase, eukaryota n=1 Tax=Tanacetum cinerariifolium TaxID=118510 RepID=A0A6L2NK71_TANCI|nr:RNA-directed DNA polymerase, eukaryota [Tanacetum cinerariifolium]